jgi:large subunit ribosomal protein L4
MAQAKVKAAQAKVRSATGGLSTREVDLVAYGEEVRPRLLKDAVVRYLANQRQGTHSTKTRKETNYSVARPWPQKHTGRARAGDKNSPLWRHGGTIFGPKPRDHRVGMPVRARREALRSALLGKFRDGEVSFLELQKLDKPSTKTAATCLKDVGATRGATVVLPPGDANLYRSFRNLERVDCVPAGELNALHVLKRRALVFVGDSLGAVEKRLANASGDKANPGESPA